MSEAERVDLLTQLAVSCDEETPLRDVTKGSTDLGLGEPVRHGPWSPDACAEVLTTWLTLGFIGLYLRSPARLDDLTATQALELLSSADRWADVSPGVCLYATALGQSRRPDEWMSAIPRS